MTRSGGSPPIVARTGFPAPGNRRLTPTPEA